MLFNYGRGRAEQFREHPTPGSALNFVPPLFLLYLLSFPIVWILPVAARWPRWAGWYSLVLPVYGLAVLLQVLALVPRGGVGRCLRSLPLIVLTHLLYGWGFWRGLFTKLKAPGERVNEPVKLEIVAK